jgi:hypothetical protein
VKQNVGKKKPFLPPALFIPKMIGGVLMSLGLAEQYGGANILPPSFQFDHDGLVLIGVGFAFTVPALARIITGILHPSKTPPRLKSGDSVDPKTDAGQSAGLRKVDNSSGLTS